MRWHGARSTTRSLPGSGAMGATLGILEYLSQTNNIADCVPKDDRYTFFDDLTTLEVIKLLTVGLSSLNLKSHIPSDLPTHGQFIDSSNLKSQQYLDRLNSVSEDKKMIISQKRQKLWFLISKTSINSQPGQC